MPLGLDLRPPSRQGTWGRREWVKLRERNEALDLEFYALAALYIPDLGPSFVRSLPERAARFARPAEKVEAPAPPTVSQSRWPLLHQPRRGWINSWRG